MSNPINSHLSAHIVATDPISVGSLKIFYPLLSVQSDILITLHVALVLT